MKTKLLRKARKRFEIVKVHSVGKNDFQYTDVSKLKVPFYIIVDRQSILYPLGACQTYERAFIELIKWVKHAYKDKTTKKSKLEKVYYNGK